MNRSSCARWSSPTNRMQRSVTPAVGIAEERRDRRPPRARAPSSPAGGLRPRSRPPGTPSSRAWPARRRRPAAPSCTRTGGSPAARGHAGPAPRRPRSRTTRHSAVSTYVVMMPSPRRAKRSSWAGRSSPRLPAVMRTGGPAGGPGERSDRVLVQRDAVAAPASPARRARASARPRRAPRGGAPGVGGPCRRPPTRARRRAGSTRRRAPARHGPARSGPGCRSGGPGPRAGEAPAAGPRCPGARAPSWPRRRRGSSAARAAAWPRRCRRPRRRRSRPGRSAAPSPSTRPRPAAGPSA